MTVDAAAIGERLAAVRARIAGAARRAGRDPAAVRLVGVSKLQPAEAIDAAYRAGLRDVGENYAQELAAKTAVVPHGDLAWHFIGRLQRNKVKLVVGRAALLHTVDSEPLAVEIARRAEAGGVRQRILCEVNLAGEAQKGGVSADELPALLAALEALPAVDCVGLMAMPPWGDDAEVSRPRFRELRALRDALAAPARPLPELSMGTTSDFEVAIEEGATLVRVGTAIFGPRPPRPG